MALSNLERDWRQTRAKLQQGATADEWAAFFETMFMAKVQRYLKPLELARRKGDQGQMVSFLAMCLIFLAQTQVSELPTPEERRRNAHAYDPAQDEEKVVLLLSKQEPFSSRFNAQEATDFYRELLAPSLRAGRGLNGWEIRARSPSGLPVSHVNKIVFDEPFVSLIERYVRAYGKALTSDRLAQQACLAHFSP